MGEGTRTSPTPPGRQRLCPPGLLRSLLHFCVLGLALSSCVPASLPTSTRLTLPERVAVQNGGRVQSVALEDYVLGSVLAEVTPTGAGETPAVVERIYEVQAILARTYVVRHLARHRAEGFDVCDTTHCQLYDPARVRTSRFAFAARDAVRRTAGRILVYAGQPADALYHADCGGRTAAADAVWGGGAVPYLTGVSDEVPSVTHREWRLQVPVADLRTALNADPRARVGQRLEAIAVERRDASGRAVRLSVRGERTVEVRGEDFRAILNRSLGARALQSTKFLMTRAETGYVFLGSGFGHGVGLCQAGAIARARQGETTRAILDHYLHGATLAQLPITHYPSHHPLPIFNYPLECVVNTPPSQPYPCQEPQHPHP